MAGERVHLSGEREREGEFKREEFLKKAVRERIQEGGEKCVLGI